MSVFGGGVTTRPSEVRPAQNRTNARSRSRSCRGRALGLPTPIARALCAHDDTRVLCSSYPLRLDLSRVSGECIWGRGTKGGHEARGGGGLEYLVHGGEQIRRKHMAFPAWLEVILCLVPAGILYLHVAFRNVYISLAHWFRLRPPLRSTQTIFLPPYPLHPHQSNPRENEPTPRTNLLPSFPSSQRVRIAFDPSIDQPQTPPGPQTRCSVRKEKDREREEKRGKGKKHALQSLLFP